MPVSAGTHVLYTVRPGDTLYSIANAFGASLEDLIQANAMYPPITDPNMIRPGWVLLVRLPGMSRQSAAFYQVNPGDTLFGIASRFSLSLDMLAGLNHIRYPELLRVGQLLYIAGWIYEVEPGDTLYRISRRFGIPLGELFRWNRNRPGLSPDVIYPGFKLALPLPASVNILVNQPLPGGRVAQGERLAGVARAFEGTILYRVVDDTGRVIVPETPTTTSAGAPAYGMFDVPLQLSGQPATPGGTLLVYTRSANDGSVQDLVEVPVTFS